MLTVMVNSVILGRFANINDILPYSDGNFANLVSDDGEAVMSRHGPLLRMASGTM